MANRRDQIRMTEAEIEEFLGTEKTLMVATNGKDGVPHLVPMWFAYDDGAVVFHTFTKSQKIKNLERDPRLSVLAESGDSYDQLRGVSIQGKAELIDGEEKFAHVVKVIRRYQDLPEEALEPAARQVAAKRTVVRVVPDKVMSWDHSKLGGTY
ncbi:MAG: PPOX class F420-dependent oxidoreductase [Acidobacteriota bacterium]